jgi:hypothetical protein
VRRALARSSLGTGTEREFHSKYFWQNNPRLTFGNGVEKCNDDRRSQQSCAMSPHVRVKYNKLANLPINWHQNLPIATRRKA